MKKKHSKKTTKKKNLHPYRYHYFFLLLLVVIIIIFLSAIVGKIYTPKQLAATSGCIGIMIPAYYGPGASMDKTIAGAGAVKFMTANPNNGPGSSVDPSWTSAITKAKAAGIRVMGYVATGHGNNSETSVKAEVDTWKRLYGVTDIMFDETWVGDTSKVTYYQDLTNYIHQQTPGSIDKDNSGAIEPEAYMQTADILGIYEGSYANYLNFHPPSWVYNYPSSRFFEEMYSVPSPSVIPSIFTLFQKNNAGYVMLTDSNNPWNQFSTDPFWTGFTSAVKTNCTGTPISGTPSSGTPAPTSPQGTPQPTTPQPTTSQGGTSFSITVCPHGIGNCGDNVNAIGAGNANPRHTSLPVTITLLNATSQPVASGQGMIPYMSSSQNFQGTISIPSVASGQYLVKITVPGYLPQQLPGIITVTSGQAVTLSSVSMITGDINSDNQLDILDYNLLISCFGSKQSSALCTTPPTQQSSGSDINDDGTVDGADYNLFLRELSVQKGNGGGTNPTPSINPSGNPSGTPAISPAAGLLPGEKIWKNGISSYIFGANNSREWNTTDNIETNATVQQELKTAGITLMRTWFFSDSGYNTDAEIDKRLQVDQTIGAQCLGELPDTANATWNEHVVQYVGNRCNIYEFGNEPGENGAPNMPAYLASWNQQIPIFRKLNPNAVFVGPAAGEGPTVTPHWITDFLNGVKASGVLPDGVTYHEYACSGPPDASCIAKATIFQQDTLLTHQMIKSILGHDLPVGLTEWNWNCCSQSTVLSDTFMQQFNTAAYTAIMNAHLDFANFFTSYNHGGTDDLDMFNVGGTPRPPYTVIQNLITQNKGP